MNFFRKDLLLFWRDRKELLISIVAPVLLVVVLGLMPDWTKGTTAVPATDVALVVEDRAEQGVSDFQASLASLPPETASRLSALAGTVHPSGLLMQALQSEEVQAFLTLEELSADEALRRLEDGQVDAVLTIPRDFTFQTLKKMLLNEGSSMPMQLTALESSTKVHVVRGIVEEFQRTLNVETALGRAGAETPGETLLVGGLERVDRFHSVSMFQYYASAIAVLFVLFVAQTTATKAAAEKREHVLHRMLAAGTSPIRYVLGKIGSTFVLAAVQMAFIFVVCQLALRMFPDRSFGFWLGAAVILTVYGLCAAAIAGLFTSLAFRMPEGAATGMMTMTIVVVGTVGGSFVPRYILPDWLRVIGEWTPNGRALSVILQWAQQESWSVAAAPLLQLLSFALLSAVAAVLLFPREERS